MPSDYSIKGYTWKCADGAATADVWANSPEADAALKPVMQKLREMEKLTSYKGNLFKPAFSYNFPGYPRHHPINLAAFPQRTVDFDMHSIEPGYGFPLHLHDYADENYLVIGGQGKVVVEGEVYDAETHDVFYIPPGKWHCAFNPADNTEPFHLFILQAPRVADELNELGYVEITKSQWDQLGLPKSMGEKSMKVLAVGAHPDDMEFLCVGTLAKYKRLGHEIAMASATNGEVGSSTLSKAEIAAIRRSEAEASAAVIGAEFHWLGYPDEFLFNNAETRLKFIDLVRQVRPDLIICHDPENDYHPDHTTAGRIIWDTHVMVTIPNIVTDHPPCAKIPEIIYMDTIGGVNFIPNRYVNISADIDAKRKMLSCHKSQEQWMIDMYDVTTLAMMENFSRMRGFQCGCAFAEGFRVPPMWPKTVDPEGLL